MQNHGRQNGNTRLPIWSDANRLLAEIKTAVRSFPRNNLDTVGSDLRLLAKRVCCLLSRALDATCAQRLAYVRKARCDYARPIDLDPTRPCRFHPRISFRRAKRLVPAQGAGPNGTLERVVPIPTLELGNDQYGQGGHQQGGGLSQGRPEVPGSRRLGV